MRAIATPAPIHRGKRRLLESCAITAGLIALAYGGPTLAQVNGTGTIVTGGAGSTIVNNGGTNTTTVTVTGNQSIVNWVPTDNAASGGAIDFLSTGENLTFSGTGNYIVLNRFVNGTGGSLSRQIALNGTVNSVDTSIPVASGAAQGGNIWFYNAGGILIGNGAAINVGSLVLTTNDIVTTGGLLGPGGTIRFRGAAGSTAGVTVNGSINAGVFLSPGSSYVALVAPRIVQSGNVRVDGSAAYVAAEQADIRINSGMFDINVLVGAEGGNVITHTGSTTGPAHQQGDIDQSRIYMVAIPKNDAVTMLVSGQVGYDDALSAQVDPDGAVRLSAGYNVTNGELNATPVNATAANITVNDTLFRSDTYARASGAFVGQPLQVLPPPFLPAAPPPGQGRILVQGNGTFIGDASATLNVNASRAVGATGNLIVQSGGVSGTGNPGSAIVNVNGGQLGVGGTLTVSAPGAVGATGGQSQAGTASLIVSNAGLVGANGNIIVSANATGTLDTGGIGRDGRGGTATISVAGTGSALTGATIAAIATGTGGGVTPTPLAIADTSGSGFGGTAELVVASGGSVTASAALGAVATGQGQTGLNQSGDGQGGTVRISVTGAGSTLQTPTTILGAAGAGGGSISNPALGTINTLAGGDGQGGLAEIVVDAGATATTNFGNATLVATGAGGAAGGENAASGNGQGGTVTVSGTGGGILQFNAINASAAGTSGSSSSPSGQSASSGNAIGGDVNITATGGSTLNVATSIGLTASGMAGISENIGSGTGGDVLVSATNAGIIIINDQLTVDAFGGSMGNVIALTAGTGTGGNVDLTADSGGAISADSYQVNATAGVVNVSGASGVAQGGTIDVTASNTGQIGVTNDGAHSFNVSARTGISAGGSAATGGTIQFIANGGDINMGAGAFLTAGGTSGGATNPGSAGAIGRGGSILVQLVGDPLNSSSIGLGGSDLSADGRTAIAIESAPALPRESAGIGRGGTVEFDIQGGSLTASGIGISADGYGGNAPGGSNGFGGTATFTLTAGSADVGSLIVSADGIGGIAAGQSGSGVGGTATINLLGGSSTTTGITVRANGQGGAGFEGNDGDSANIVAAGRGGNALGGTAAVNIAGSAIVNTETISANAFGFGGTGGAFVNQFSFSGVPGDAGNGGDGVGGNATVEVTGGTVNASGLIANTSGVGGDGGDSFFSSSSGGATGVGVGGTGGTGQGGTATIALQATIDSAGIASSIARGTGGNGGDHNVGGGGGDGLGGVAQAIVTNFEAGELAVTLDSTGTGGNGASGRDGAGGVGGDGTGGTSRIFADGPEASVTAVETNFITGGQGGNGGNGQRGFGSFLLTAPSGGNGGTGQGGTIEVNANEGATVSLGVVSGDAIVFSSTGTGGNGGNGAGSVFDTNAASGNGGNGGGGNGGAVRLLTNGGTITSNTETVEINASGVAGTGGAGGIGQGGGSDGGTGGSLGTAGGRVTIEALRGVTGPGQIALGDTSITANGDLAGRVELRAEGDISFRGLDVEALGFANPTNNDTDVAPAGIFLAMTGGTISSQGDAALATGGSVGAYAQSNGMVDIDGSLTIEAGDQIDIRHDFREGIAPTIRASDTLSLTTVNSISAAPGSRLIGGESLLLQATGVNGSIGVDRLDGTDITLITGGAASVEHAEADNNFIATVGSFRTGLNSIITGGDIIIGAAGAVDLGNSDAGGRVQVSGQSIVFNNIDAGAAVVLSATGTTPGAEGISGVSINAGDSVGLGATRIAITGTVEGGGTFSANASAGPVAISLANFGSEIQVSASGDITGTYNTLGDIRLNSGGNIIAAANATGFESSSSGLPITASVYADAVGNVTMANSSATGMFGVNAGGSASLNGVAVGEDALVRAGTTASLTNVTVGDDLTVRAANIVSSGLVSTGDGPDGRTLGYNDNPSSITGFGIATSPLNGSNIALTATVGNISVASANAFDNLTATAVGTVTSTGALQSGQATTLSGSSLILTSITAGTDIGLTATTGGVSSTGALAAGHDVTITSPGAVNVSELDAGDDIRVNTNAALTIGGAYSYGSGLDNEGDGSNIVLTGGVTNVTHAEADNDFIASAASFTTGLNSIITGGDIIVTSPGAVDLGNSSAGGFVSVAGQSIDFNNIIAGTTVGLNATGTAAGAEGIRGVNITAGGDINLFGNSIAVAGTTQGTASLFAFAGGGNAAIALADMDGNIGITADGDITGNFGSGGNIDLTAGGNITAQANATGGYVSNSVTAEGNVFVDADGNATLTSGSAARMLGVRAGQNASASNATAGEDVLVLAGNTATLTNISAGDDLTATAGGSVIANGLTTTGAGPDARALNYSQSASMGLNIFQIAASPADGSNIALTASAGNIGGGNLNAFDNLVLTAAVAVTTTGTLRSGQATSIAGRSILFDAINAGGTVDVSANGTAAAAEGIRGASISAGGDINLNGNSIALTGIVNGDASLFATGTGGSVAINQADLDGDIVIDAAGNLTGTYGAGGNVRLTSDANIDASATANGVGASDGNLYVDAVGNVALANSSAARMFGVNAGGSATITNGQAGEDMLVRTGTTASLTNVTAGDDVDIRAGGNVTANNVRATGTGADTHFLNYLPASGFTITQGEGTSAVNGSDVIATSGGSINASGLSAGDDILLTASTGNVQLSNATTLGLGSIGGSSNIRVEAIDAALAGLDSADDVLVTASGAANIGGAIVADRNISIVAGTVDLATLATPAGDAVNTLSADGNVTITSANDIDGGRIRALGDIALTAGAAVDVTGIFGNNVAVDGATGIAAEQLFAVGTTTLNSDNGAITLGALVSSGNVDARADSILIDGGSMVFSNIVTDVGDAVVRAGDLFVINGNIAGRAEFSSGGERLGIDTLVARSASLDASGGFMTLNNVTVTGGLAASARTSLSISGVVTGQSISLESASIDIASSGRVGTAGATGEVSIANNNSDNQTFVGGTGTPNGYHIDAAELTRVFGSDIEIFAPEVQAVGGGSVGSAAPPDVIVDSFTMTGGAANSNLGANGVLTIRTPGKMRVIGNVQLTGLTDTNRLNLFADQALEVILGQGSVRLVNGSAPAGQLTMASDDIIVATAAAIADVGTATTTDAIETRLAQNDGIVLDEGALFARGIRADVVGGFYVQNSGSGTAYAQRRGLTFGAGGLDVLTEGPSRIVLNGVHLGPNGQITGLDTIPLLTIGGGVPAPGSFDPRSTFNGCLITGAAACTVLSLESSFPVQDVIENETDADGDGGDANILPTPLITIRDLDPLSGEPLLDDPVTGAGNDDLWTPTIDTCDPASTSGGSCPAAE
ncbi:MAG: hypothetical protein Q7T68_20290 [Sphingopyxis sp.]|nr:hypothetical protein [Sphingopyxis sp.]